MKYIGFYDTKMDRRSMSIAATNKMNYICEALNAIGEPVEIISCGMIADNAIPATQEKLLDNTVVKYFKTRRTSPNKLKRIYNVFAQNITLFCYLLKYTSKNEKVLVYHSLGLMRCVYLAKKIKRFKTILEVEEFYNDVELKSRVSARMEKKIIESADAYLFPTKLLNDKFNADNKPTSLIHGTYKVEPDSGVSFGDDKIHVVYAGTFNLIKGGAAVSASIAEWLPENYHVHIIGFGSDEETEHIKNIIKETNLKSKAIVTYDGLLSGEDYIQFLQKCQIGLSTQNPDADFNASSFPSKILSYMANGLRVVTIRIPAIATSDIGKDVYYYDTQESNAIAEAIMKVKLNDDYDSRKRIEELNEKFKTELSKLFALINNNQD